MSAPATAKCFDCQWSWTGPEAEAERRIAMHLQMFPGHSARIITVPPPEPDDYPCKIGGCSGRSTVKMGPYAYLCEEHKAAAPSGGRGKKSGAKPARVRGLEDAPEPAGTDAPDSLDALADDVRRAREAYETAVDAFEEAVKRVREDIAA